MEEYVPSAATHITIMKHDAYKQIASVRGVIEVICTREMQVGAYLLCRLKVARH